MQDIVNSDVTLTVDMGSFHIWIARYLYSFRARQVMISNGQQTMGVALPWAIGAWLVNPERKVVSVSGDGGFLAVEHGAGDRRPPESQRAASYLGR
ncbi:thiamine pyrophosphate-dependent enzyme [Klebsiella pneumoniae subsp. pneumoniae]|nr:thiamine pyrophosphate-dependent enzyme [Klebsiella pneumoniae subsp. pneumoniae]